MFSDDRDLADLISQGLKSYAEDAAAGRQSAWPRIQSALHQRQTRRRRGISRLWIMPAVVLPLAISAGTATALYSHSDPIVWIFHQPTKPAPGKTVHAYYPPPKAVSLRQGASLLQVPRLVVDGGADSQLKSVTFQGATTASKSHIAASEKGSVTLIYIVQGQIISLREYNSGPGPLDANLKRSSSAEGPGETLSVMTVDGSTYQVEQNASNQVLYVEWKTLSGVLVLLNGRVSQPLAVSFVQSLLPHIH
ncbi:MAG: hypothetical protein WB116_11850 [Candidatus Dormiibacterota bacterium]